MSFGIATSSYHESLAIARETGQMHAEHVAQLLASTPEDQRSALVEAGRMRLARFISDNSPAGAPGSQILDAALRSYDSTLNA